MTNTMIPMAATVAVRDPLRSGFRMLQIPISAVLPTRASRAPRGDGQQLSLCLLFQVNQCASGEACRHVHVTPKDVGAARQACDRVPAAAPVQRSCCALHDRTPAPAATTATFNVQVRGHPVLPLDISKFAPTQALSSIVEDATTDPINIGYMRVCRSHVDNSCKLGAACRNVHVCREAWRAATKGSGGAVVLPPILSAPHPPAGPRPAAPAKVVASAVSTGDVSVSFPEVDNASSTEFASSKLTPHPPTPTPPSRATSPTQQCLSRFVRRWNNPNIRCSGGSTVTASEDEGMCLNASLEAALLGMTDGLRVSTASSVHTPTPPPQQDNRPSFDRQFFSIVA